MKNRNNYFTNQPIRNKAIAPETEKVFCKDYNTHIRYACAVNSNGNKIWHLVKVGNKFVKIILN